MFPHHRARLGEMFSNRAERLSNSQWPEYDRHNADEMSVSLHGGGKWEYPEETTDLGQANILGVTKLCHMVTNHARPLYGGGGS